MISVPAVPPAQVSVNRSMPVSAAQKNGPSGTAYVTYYRPEDALRCIESVDGQVWEGEQHSTAQHNSSANSAQLLWVTDTVFYSATVRRPLRA